MLRIAVLEKEEVAKELIFQLGKRLYPHEWSFQYFDRISEFARAQAKHAYQIVIFHEKFNVPRVTQSFVLSNPQSMFVYTMNGHLPQQSDSNFQRILYIHRSHVAQELDRIFPVIQQYLRNEEEYLFSYNNIKVPLKISNIYYIEKEDKLLVYHTSRGEFRERKSMKHAWTDMEKYHFLWIHASYMVNMQYITRVASDIMELGNVKLPIARARKQDVLKRMRDHTSNG